MLTNEQIAVASHWLKASGTLPPDLLQRIVSDWLEYQKTVEILNRRVFELGQSLDTFMQDNSELKVKVQELGKLLHESGDASIEDELKLEQLKGIHAVVAALLKYWNTFSKAFKR